MYKIEFHPGEGGEDAALFASDLASAVAKHCNSIVSSEGNIFVVATSQYL